VFPPTARDSESSRLPWQLLTRIALLGEDGRRVGAQAGGVVEPSERSGGPRDLYPLWDRERRVGLLLQQLW
jgi:hypothetical protein